MRVLSFLLPAAALARTQVPFFGASSASQQLAPESSAGFITEDSFTTLTHPEVESTSVRIKRNSGWCDSSVESYSGYIDSGDRHLFFYYFDSRGDPAKDDLVLWTNGGPGCSSSMGLLMELGPCNAQPDGNSTKPNPYSWNNEASMIFIDQPIGVGFSYSSSSDVYVSTTEQAALDIHAFLVIFFASFPQHDGRAFHLSGESYGGRYLPVFATEIVHQNALLAKKKNATRKPINLKSVMIGNGLTDVVSMSTSYYDQACTSGNGLGKPVLDVKTCMTMQQSVKRCDKWLDKVCRESVSEPECSIATQWCGEQLTYPFILGEINPYDISKPCTTLGEDLCYPETSAIGRYLDQPWVRKTLGAHEGIGKFQSCSNIVGQNFGLAGDGLAPTFYHLTGLLENGIRVLIYVGMYDWICNYIGNERMLAALEWSGKEGFNATPLRDFFVEGAESRAGQTKSFGLLTWVQIEGAGHMVPLDKPAESLHVTKQWLAKADI